MTAGRWAASGAGLLVLGGLVAWAQAPDAKESAKPPPANAPKKDVGKGFPDLVRGLKESPGCLGVETARTSSGKSVIFAWFKDKQATLRWYHSAMHRRFMRNLAGGPSRPPMEKIPDDGKPILVIASVTPAKEPKFGEVKMPISQIAIELYRPLPGGAALGGRFAPQSLQLEDFREDAAEPEAESPREP